MSRSYPHADQRDKITSPLDRQPQQLYPAGQPPSFKTNVNRAKTKKWVEAKSYSYEGDDWGDYDEDDEYGVEAASSQPVAQDQRPPGVQPARSSTTPIGPPLQIPRRPPSFDAGDERRAFSAGSVPPPQMQELPLHVDTNAPSKSGPEPNTSGTRQFSAASFAPSHVSEVSSVDPRHRANYSPSAEPPPLHMRNSPVPSSAASATVPLPTSSEQPSAVPGRPPSAGSASSATRIIRPADIYKRVAEEREKERRSLERQRDTPESVAGQSAAGSVGTVPEPVPVDSVGPGRQTQMRPTLASLPERKSEYGEQDSSNVPAASNSADKDEPVSPKIRRPGTNPPQLPQLGNESTFGDTFWESTPLGSSSNASAIASAVPASTSSNAPESGADATRSRAHLQHQPSTGFTSLVHQAFDAPLEKPKGDVSKQDSTRSVANSSVSRSDTTATSDISPIMSRMPSSATAAAKAKSIEPQPATPVITEESGEAASVKPQQASPPDGHSRSGSAEFIPGYRRALNTPSPHNSPARTPIFEENKQLAHSGVADLSTRSRDDEAESKPLPQLPDMVATGSTVPLAQNEAETAFREVDSPQNSAPEAFLEQRPSLPAASSSAIKREESPSKGRVADLAGRYNEMPEQRRGSVDSWEVASSNASVRNATGVSEDDTVALSPPPPPDTSAGVVPDRPPAGREISFRPRLPGQWDSFVTTNSEKSHSETSNPRTTAAVEDSQAFTADDGSASTSAKDDEENKERLDQAASSMAALAAAGAAIGEAIKKSVGLDTSEKSDGLLKRAFGDILQRPIAPERTESSVSSAPPTPPEKDVVKQNVHHQEISPAVPLKEPSDSVVSGHPSATEIGSPVVIRTSSDDSVGDLESDRLRKEIERSLSPVEPTSVAQAERPLSNTLTTTDDQASASNRESSVIPMEYESYWNDKEVVPAERSSVGLPEVSIGNFAPTEAKEIHPPKVPATVAPSGAIGHPEPSAPETLTSDSAFLTKRFSWEKDAPQPAAPTAVENQATSTPFADSQAPVAGVTSTAAEESKVDALDISGEHPRFSGESLHVVNAEPGEVPQLPIADAATSPAADQPGSPKSLDAPRAAPARSSRELGADPGLFAFRDIAAHKSQEQRIAKFKTTRDLWTGYDMGVGTWLDHLLYTQPEYRGLANELTGSSLPGPGTRGHKAHSSISRVFTGSKGMPAPQSAADESVYAGPSQVTTPNSSHRNPSAQGKELLQAAGALGGKGMKGAKGLFAKGKNKIRGSISHEKALSPLPSSANNDAHALEKTESWDSGVASNRNSSVKGEKRTSRSFSPFRRSRPTSIVLAQNAEVSANHLHDETTNQGTRRKSFPMGRLFGRAEDESTPPQDNERRVLTSHPAEVPTDDIQRPLTPQRMPQRLGILPSPAIEPYGRPDAASLDTEKDGFKASNGLMPSKVLKVSNTTTPEDEKTPTQANLLVRTHVPVPAHITMPDDERLGGAITFTQQLRQGVRQQHLFADPINTSNRVVSMVHPEDANAASNEPVSPIESEPEDGAHESSEARVSRTPSKATDSVGEDPSASSGHRMNVKVQDGTWRRGSRGSIDSWERDESPGVDLSQQPPTEPIVLPAAAAKAVLHGSSGMDNSSMQTTTNLAESPCTPNKLRTTSEAFTSSTTIAEGLEDVSVANDMNVTEQSARDAPIATSDHGAGQIVLEGVQPANGSKSNESSFNKTHVEGSDSDYVSGVPTPGVSRKSHLVTSTEQPDTTSYTSSVQVDRNEQRTTELLEPPSKPSMMSAPSAESSSATVPKEGSNRELYSAEILNARPMPTISSANNMVSASSAHHAGDLPNEQALPQPRASSISNDANRRVHLPLGSDIDRPMSFVSLPRDLTGIPTQEQISIGRPDQGEILPPLQQLQRFSGRQQAPHGQSQRSSGLITKPPPIPPPLQIQAPRLSTNVQRPGAPVMRDPYAQGQFIGNQAFGRGTMDPRQLHAEYQLPGIGPPPVDPPGTRRTNKGLWPGRQGQQATPADVSRINPQLVVAPQAVRQQSYQSVNSQDTVKEEKKKRHSGIMAAFKRPSSAGAESSLSSLSRDASSVMAQASESPTRREYLRSPSAPVGSIPPSQDDIPPAPPTKDKVKSSKHTEKSAKLQRASTTQVAEQGKKKRFSALTSIFGRTSSTGHATLKRPKLNPEQSHQGTIFHRVPETPQNRSANDRSSPQQPSRNSPGMPPPPGGYYAPGNQMQQTAPGAFPPPHASPVDLKGPSVSAANTHSVGPHFNRQHSIASSQHSGPVSVASPIDFRAGSTGAISSVSSMSSPLGQSPAIAPQQPSSFRRWTGGPRMSSIGEQHQERPWQVSLPDAHEDDPQQIAQEIMRAASARWRRDPQDYSPIQGPSSTQSPISPHQQLQAWSVSNPTSFANQQHLHGRSLPSSPHEQQDMQNSQHFQQSHDSGQVPANPVYTYVTTGPPHQYGQLPQPNRGIDYHHQHYSQQQYVQSRSPLSPQQNHGPPLPETLHRQASDSRPQIPPLPQAQIPILQPQPRYAEPTFPGYSATTSQNRLNHPPIGLPIEVGRREQREAEEAQQRHAHDLRPDADVYRSNGTEIATVDPQNGLPPPVPSKIGIQLPGGRIGVALPGLARQESEKKERDEARAAAAAAAKQSPHSPSSPLSQSNDGGNNERDPDEQAAAPDAIRQQLQPRSSIKEALRSSTEAVSKDSAASDDMAGRTPQPPQPQHEQKQSQDPAPKPQSPIPNGLTVSNDSAARHKKEPSTDSDYEPVMMATSYPGDEWIPTWDGE